VFFSSLIFLRILIIDDGSTPAPDNPLRHNVLLFCLRGSVSVRTPVVDRIWSGVVSVFENFPRVLLSYTYTAVSRVVMTWGVLSVGLTSSRVVQLRIGLLGAGHGAAYRRDAHVCYKQCFGLMKTIQSSGIRQFSRLSANLS